MNRIFQAYLIILLVFPESSLISTAFYIKNLFLLLLIPYIWEKCKYSATLLDQERKLFLSWIVFLFYLYSVDAIKYGLYESLPIFCIAILYLLLFYTIIRFNFVKSYYKGHEILYFTYKLSLIPVALGLIQIFYPALYYQNFNSYIPFINIVSTNAPVGWIESGRITGPATLSNWLAIFIGYIMILCLYFFKITKNKKHIIYLFALYIIGIFTYTRSFIWGIFPSIIISYFIIYGFIRPKYFLTSIFLAGTFFAIFTIVLIPYLQKTHYRSGIFWDRNTGSKLSSNYYCIVGTLKKDPLFGIERSEYKQIAHTAMLKSRVDILSGYSVQETFHNQIARYFILYGIFGLLLFSIFVLNIFRVIFSIDNRDLKFVTLALFIYFLQYSLMHNTLIVIEILTLLLIAVIYRTDKIYRRELT